MKYWRKRLAAVACVVAVGSAVLGGPLTAIGAPVQQQPSVRLKASGTLGATTIPLLVTWPAASPDATTINHYELERSRDGGPWTPVSLPRPLARSITTRQPAWRVLVFRVRAVDQAGRASDWALSVPVWM